MVASRHTASRKRYQPPCFSSKNIEFLFKRRYTGYVCYARERLNKNTPFTRLALKFRLRACALACALIPVLAVAGEQNPVLMEADKLGYEKTHAVVVALGHVKIVQDNQILTADRVIYFQQQNVVQAEGNVRVQEPTGNVYFADKLQLKDDLKAGVVRQFRARMSDNSVFAANEAVRPKEYVTEMHKAVYSPCKICKDAPPFWQLKADKVTYDELQQSVEYDDVRMEMFGVPVLYSPYLSTPSPGADRKSGILIPEYEQSTNLGSTARVPYYWNISPDKDATITPILTSDEGLIVEGQYRQRTDRGQYKFNGSATYPRRRDALGAPTSGSQFRGHVFANGGSQLNDHWGWGFDVQRSTDDTYLRKYSFGNQELLTSRLFTEGLFGRSYVGAQTMAFQGLRATDDPGTSPLILPLLEAYYESDPGWNGSRLHVGGNGLLLTRSEGSDVRRLSLDTGWSVPFISDGGHVFEFGAGLRNDFYSISDEPVTTGTTTTEVSDNLVRSIPTASIQWRYPLMKQVGDGSLGIEPIAIAVASTNGNNPSIIPDEDAAIQELSDVNIFSLNRFTGFDRVDNGSRVAYGMRGHWMWPSGDNLNFLVGQNYITEQDTPYPHATGGDQAFSDMVGMLGLELSPISLAYRMRMDHEDYKTYLNDLSFRYRYGRLGFGFNYLDLADNPLFNNREELLSDLYIKLSEEWSLAANSRRDLKNDAMLDAGLGLTYQNECFTLITHYRRDFTRDRDVEPGSSVGTKVIFKNLN